MSGLRICLIASSRFPVAEPFVGGLEAHTHSLASALLARGHSVSLFAARGSDESLNVENLPIDRFTSSAHARRDLAAPPEEWMQEHDAYLRLMLDLAASGDDRFDVIHNNSLHHLPIAMSSAVRVPMLTTLHTPPTPWLESAMRVAAPSSSFAAVSAFTAEQWRGSTDARVVLNGVDTARWSPGPGGEAAVWFGRLVPEKGPHLAIDVARRAGMPLRLAGPALDAEYFAEAIAPRLGPDVTYLGHLSSAELIGVVGRSAVTIVSPQWDEPYGLVAAESMACGTPVAAFRRGGLPESLSDDSGRLAARDDVTALAAACREAATLSREATRLHALRRCSLDVMIDGYESLYASHAERSAA